METSIPDSILMKRIKKKDMQAVLEWFDARQTKFYKIGWAYLKNHHDVEDVFHNTILKVHDKIEQLKKDHYFETWVTSIFLNECKSIYRKRNRNRQVLGSPPETVEISPFASKLEVLEDLNHLEDIHKEVILLKYVQGFSQKEIAHVLDLPVGTVKSRLYRGLMTLRKIIEGGGGNGL